MNENFFETNNKKYCNGCGVCAMKCPQRAISMIKDLEGFAYPKVDFKKCINCGLCKKICSNIPETNTFNIRVYIAKNKNENERLNSTSGGMFKLIAQEILKDDGIVYGVKFDKKMQVIHSYATTIDECFKFSSSKYVRSDIGNSYHDIENFLKDGKQVLFTGTPCQCYALKKYLNKEYERLITCEIICHSNPSPMIFKMFISNLEKEHNKKIIDFKFRSKKEFKKAHAITDDNNVIIDDSFNRAFGNMLISRPSCSACNFCNENRKADITIGDFWGAEKMFPELYDNNGISLLCINSIKGESMFKKIQDKMIYKEADLHSAFKYNHNSNIKEHKNRKKFFDMISKGIINDSNIIKYMNKATKMNIFKKIKNKIIKI